MLPSTLQNSFGLIQLNYLIDIKFAIIFGKLSINFEPEISELWP
jgi:hypothetical protein